MCERSNLKRNPVSYSLLANFRPRCPMLSTECLTCCLHPPSGLRRQPMKPALRTKSVSEVDFAVLEDHARSNGLTLSERVRHVFLSAPGRADERLHSLRTLGDLLLRSTR